MENKIAYKAFASPQAFVKSRLVIVVCFSLQDNEKDLMHKNWSAFCQSYQKFFIWTSAHFNLGYF